MVNQQQPASRSIRSLPLRQRVFVGFLFLLALLFSLLVLLYVDPSTAIYRGSVGQQPLPSPQSVVLG